MTIFPYYYMAVQQFCLRWNNHQPNFISVFSSLLNSESLVDVTLAAEGKQIQAHKVVLSACSTYFQSLFTMNPCQHPIVILKDIKFCDLKIMVDFMYCGEVNVSQDQLPAILKTAETLKIKGLTEMREQNISLSKSISLSEKSCDSSALRRKRLRKSSTGSGSGSGSTEHTGTVTGGSEETVGSIDVPVLPSSPTIKTEPSEGEGSLRHEPSTESEPGFTSQESVEDETQPQRLSEEAQNDLKIECSDSKSDEISPGAATKSPTTPGWMYMEAGYPQKPMSYLHSQPSTRPRRKRSVNPQQGDMFLQALEAVRHGHMGFCKAAKLYGVNNRTLWLEYKKRGYPILRPSTKHRSLLNSMKNADRSCSSPIPASPFI